MALILRDFTRRVRLKIWATTTVQDAGEIPELAARLTDPSYKAKIERLISLTIHAYDWNCPQHIVPRFTEEEISADPSRLIPPEFLMGGIGNQYCRSIPIREKQLA